MALEEIERLKEKVDNDPNSKLFIPLAEEYKKAGMFDEAIDVLIKGLEKQPGYMSARVSLGKILFERGMLQEAKAEFEKVIGAIPDNLYAHKRLAEIYRDLGERDRAVKEFKTVLKLNPMDEWAATNLSDIEEGPKPQPEVSKTDRNIETFQFEPEAVTEIEEEKSSQPQRVSDEIPVSEEIIEGVDIAPSETVEVAEEAVGDVIEAEELPEEEILSFEGIFKEPEVAVESEIRRGGEKDETMKKEEVSEQPSLSIGDADPYIIQDKFMEAMNIYRRILSIEPGNMHVMQRIEELRALLKLLGKDKEELIAKLDSLLAGIRKRRDEFLGST
ncbi:MAG: tetratricopeptide repeat protein [Nitrospirota bacterium]|nr:tetratricopeptide repeat protein [Nitrospirota bacterium]